IREFLRALFGEKPEQLYFLVWLLDGKRSAWFMNIDQAAAYIEHHGAEDVYAGVALSPEDFGPGRRCKADHTAGIVAFCADLDFRSKAHKKPNLPPTLKDALELIPPELPPSIIVDSGHGVQVWWILNNPWLFKNDADRGDAAALAER